MYGCCGCCAICKHGVSERTGGRGNRTILFLSKAEQPEGTLAVLFNMQATAPYCDSVQNNALLQLKKKSKLTDRRTHFRESSHSCFILYDRITGTYGVFILFCSCCTVIEEIVSII